MRYLIYLFATLCFFLQPMIAEDQEVKKEMSREEKVPKYLYKVLSVNDWNESQGKPFVKLPKEDQSFIHLSRDDQIERIVVKYWIDVPAFVILKLDSSKLPGKLVYETNPGGENKYWHLYDGSLPLDAVVESKVI